MGWQRPKDADDAEVREGCYYTYRGGGSAELHAGTRVMVAYVPTVPDEVDVLVWPENGRGEDDGGPGVTVRAADLHGPASARP